MYQAYMFSISLVNEYRAECNSLQPCETFDVSHKEIWIYLSVKCLHLNFRPELLFVGGDLVISLLSS